MRFVHQEAGSPGLCAPQSELGSPACLAFPSGGSGPPIVDHVPCIPPPSMLGSQSTFPAVQTALRDVADELYVQPLIRHVPSEQVLEKRKVEGRSDVRWASSLCSCCVTSAHPACPLRRPLDTRHLLQTLLLPSPQQPLFAAPSFLSLRPKPSGSCSAPTSQSIGSPSAGPLLADDSRAPPLPTPLLPRRPETPPPLSGPLCSLLPTVSSQHRSQREPFNMRSAVSGITSLTCLNPPKSQGAPTWSVVPGACFAAT